MLTVAWTSEQWRKWAPGNVMWAALSCAHPLHAPRRRQAAASGSGRKLVTGSLFAMTCGPDRYRRVVPLAFPGTVKVHIHVEGFTNNRRRKETRDDGNKTDP